MRYQNKTIANTIVLVDGDQFEGCTFNACVIQYAGGALPVIRGCTFDAACKWQFVGAADLTVRFLKLLYNVGGNITVAQQIIDIIQQSPDFSGVKSGFSGLN